MGTWGTALYSDDLAADLRSDLRDLFAEGLSAEDAVARLSREYESSIRDADESCVFWLAVADAAWRLGRPSDRATAQALRVVDDGADLRRWPDPKDRAKRSAVLHQLASRLQSAPPSAKRIAKRHVAANDWEVGELVAYRLISDAWTLFRVIGHHADKGGRHAVCEPLCWTGAEPPDPAHLPTLEVRPPSSPWASKQFLLAEPRRKEDAARFVRTGARSIPSQKPRGYTVFVFPHFDRRPRSALRCAPGLRRAPAAEQHLRWADRYAAHEMVIPSRAPAAMPLLTYNPGVVGGVDHYCVQSRTERTAEAWMLVGRARARLLPWIQLDARRRIWNAHTLAGTARHRTRRARRPGRGRPSAGVKPAPSPSAETSRRAAPRTGCTSARPSPERRPAGGVAGSRSLI